MGFIASFMLGAYATYKTHSTYTRYGRVGSRTGMTGAEVAREILDRAAMEEWAVELDLQRKPTTRDVRVEIVPGILSDHYSPVDRVLRLSPDVYRGTSLASCGIAAHEAGHAVQHAKGYAPLHLRTALYPLAAIGSQAWMWLMLLGFLVGGMQHLGPVLTIGIAAFSCAVAFYVVTLPVEFDASRRAMVYLREYGILASDELVGARKVLTAAALTYVAAALTAVLQLLYLLALRRDE
jgi:hypothetical protein